MLACTGLEVRFGGVVALDGVDFPVARGSITALIGPNGAGKTTLLNAVTGLVRVAGGAITLNGADITALPPHRRAAAGVVRTFQNLETFSNMSVLENVMTGAHRVIRYPLAHALFKTPLYFRRERACRDHAMAQLDFVGLAHLADAPATELAYGSLRLMEIARALAAQPELLLLDEPAAGLNMKETRTLGAIIRRIRDERGVTVALVEHDMDLIMDISDAITVLNFGRELAHGTPAEIQRNPAVVAAYLGEDEAEDAAPGAGKAAQGGGR
ncbi:MAG: ABC transporter ATP-binding protein [Desulfovibrionaceae bacterium]|nr:ABC transporter ATP-binding protein [Desulfovibrionaceae bacterium]